MDRAALDYLRDFSQFSQESMNWCATESEKSTNTVTEVVKLIISDAQRVSSLSKESLDAVQQLQDNLTKIVKKNNPVSLSRLIKSLQVLSNDHQEINKIINPIIESLQFQDRLRQNLENCGKMVETWLAMRQTFFNQGHCNESDIKLFGEALLKNTTMKSERDVIRNSIDGLSNNETDNAVSFF